VAGLSTSVTYIDPLTTNSVLHFAISQGVKGDTGTMSVNSTTTLGAGGAATVTAGGTHENALLNFGIPQVLKVTTHFIKIFKTMFLSKTCRFYFFHTESALHKRLLL